MTTTDPTTTAPLSTPTIRGSWYLDGGQWVVVLTGQPHVTARVGTGPTVAAAWDSLADTAMQSAIGDDGALAWAQHQGWIEDAADLEPANAEAADSVTRPVGEIGWSDDSIAYVDTCYGADGDSPGDCYVRVGEDDLGLWWLDDGDDSHRETSDRRYDTEDDAREAAQALADEQHKGEPGEDAEEMTARLLDDAAGEPDDDGEWACYWDTVGDGSCVEARYETQDQAEAAVEIANAALKAANPGNSLLCGYEVRQLVDDEWVAVDADES